MTDLTEVNTIPDNAIPDVKEGTVLYYSEIYTLYRAGIINGSDKSGSFLPASNIKRSEVYTVYSWSGSTENYNASRVSVELENATPRRLDTTQAVVTLNSSAKTITITGLRPRRGTIISLQ